MILEEILKSAGEQLKPRAPRPLVDAQISTLRELCDSYTAPIQFKPGQIVSTRKGVNQKFVGQPMIVVEVSQSNPRTFDQIGGWTHGARSEVRCLVLSSDNENYVPFWFDRFELVAFEAESSNHE